VRFKRGPRNFKERGGPSIGDGNRNRRCAVFLVDFRQRSGDGRGLLGDVGGLTGEENSLAVVLERVLTRLVQGGTNDLWVSTLLYLRDVQRTAENQSSLAKIRPLLP